MYIKTPRARVWISSDTEDTFTAKIPQRKERQPSQTIEARKAFSGKLGRYIAIRRIPPSSPGEKEVLLVAIANTSLKEAGPAWVRAEHAITSREVAQWVRDGF